jgi:ribosomal protein S18 acetylase RimI-like enzyme
MDDGDDVDTGAWPRRFSGVHLHRVTDADWASHRDLRLAMLQDAPDAFWTTYDDVAGYTDEQWQRSLTGPARFLQARAADGTPLGTLGVLPQGYADTIPLPFDAGNLVAMYVVTGARGRGVGDLLMGGARQLALDLGRTRLLLEVSSDNAPAIALYERTGFRFTGNTVPHPRRADLVEREMEWQLSR